MIIATRDNEIGSWSLAIVDVIGTYPIHRQLARTNKVKELIRIGRTYRGVRASRADRGGGRVGRADRERRLVELIKLVGLEELEEKKTNLLLLTDLELKKLK